MTKRVQNNENGHTLSSQAQRTRVLFKLSERFGWVCWYCNLPLKSVNERVSENQGIYFQSKNVQTHIDHIIPTSEGGTDGIDNLALACEFCNRAKLHLTADTYLTWLDRVRFGETWSPIRDGVRVNAVVESAESRYVV